MALDFSEDAELVEAPDFSEYGTLVAASKPGKSLGDMAKDSGIALARGIIGLPEAAVGMADLVTGGYAGKLAEGAGFRPKEAKDMLAENYSPQQQEANAAVNDAKGFSQTVGAMLKNPSTIANQALESAPSMLGGGAVSRGLLKIAPAVGPILAGAAGEGVVAAGQNAEQVRQEEPTGTLSAKQAAILAASGVLTSGISLASGKLANKMGLGDLQTMLASGKLGALGKDAIEAGAKKGMLRKVGEGIATEGIGQELGQSYQEQVGQNLAQDKPWSKGAAEAGAQGMLVGGMMGGGSNVISHFGESHASATPAPTPADILAASDVDSAIALSQAAVTAGQQFQDLGLTQPADDLAMQRQISSAQENLAARAQAQAQDQAAATQIQSERNGASASQARDQRLQQVGQAWKDLGIADPAQDLQAQRAGMRPTESTDGTNNGVVAESAGIGDVPGVDAGAGLADGGRLIDGASGRNADPAEVAVADSATVVAAEPAGANTAAVAFPYTKNPSGTVTVEGDPSAIRAALPGLKSTAVFKNGNPFGVLFATSSAPTVIAKLETIRVQDPTPRSKPAPEPAATEAPATPAAPATAVATNGLPAATGTPMEAAGVVAGPTGNSKSLPVLASNQPLAHVAIAPEAIESVAIPFSERPALAPDQQQQVDAANALDIERKFQQDLKAEYQRKRGLLPAASDAETARSPFKSFIITHGISDKPSDIVGEGNAFRANQILPTAFRKTGIGMDLLLNKAVEAGFISAQDQESGDGAAKLTEMIRTEIAGTQKHFPMDMQDDSAQARTEQAQRLEIEGSADKLGLPYTFETSTDRLASMVKRIERIQALPKNKIGLLKPERVLQNARETVARIEKKRAQFEAENDDFAKANIKTQDAELEVQHDSEGNPVITRIADWKAVAAWLEENEQWDNSHGIDTSTNSDPRQAGAPVANGAQGRDLTSDQERAQAQYGSAEAPRASGEVQEGLTAPTRADVLAQQERTGNAAALDDKAQIDKEASLQTLTQQTAPEQRRDTSGDMFAQEKAQAEIDKRNAGVQVAKDPNQAGMFDEPSDPVTETKATLDANNVTGKERLDVIKDVKSGALTVEEVQEAYPAKIEDVGEKIGGARKDTAISTGAKRKTEAQDDGRPTWANRFQIGQIAKGFDMSVNGRDVTGKWTISDVRNKDRLDQPKQMGGYFDSKEEAEKALPLLALAQKHLVVSVRTDAYIAPTEVSVNAQLANDMAAKAADDNAPGKFEYGMMQNVKKRLASGSITQADYDRVTPQWAEKAALYTPPKATAETPSTGTAYEIWRDINDHKRVKVVDQQFDTRLDAMKYMAAHAKDILETSTTFGEADLPKPESTLRKGAERRTGNVVGEDFNNTFGFRGVEFGNWNNQTERQEVMNEAFDGLHDLAEVLGLPPKAIGLNGDLALAFGARGQGLSSARAHYEREHAVMNLTKMNGAGALAHEWFHALDHYLARQDGKAASEWTVKPDGTRTFKINASPEADYVSSGFKYKSGVREELQSAYTTLVKSLFTKAEQYVEDTAKADKFVGKTREELEKQLSLIRVELTKGPETLTYMKRNNKPASAEQLADFDAIAAELVEGRGLQSAWTYTSANTSARARGAMAGRHSNESLEKLSAIYKAVRGRSGFDSTNKNGVFDSLRSYMSRYNERLKMLSDASNSTEKTKQVPTNFAMDARSLDQGRGKDYWTTPHEMVARAFQGYVEDMIEAKGGKSPFLNYAPENVGILTPWGVKRPYPSGPERKAMNQSFDTFVGEIKTKETEQGTAMFSREGKDASQEENALQALSENDELFALPKSDKDTVSGIAADTDPSIQVKEVKYPGLTKHYVLTMPDGSKAKLMVRAVNPYGPQTYGLLENDDGMEVITERPGDNAESVPNDMESVYIDVSELKEGGFGGKIYNIAATYAHNTGRILIGDPAGLSDVAMRRRTEHMLSSALKFGTTRHLAPHPRQVQGVRSIGVPPLFWTYGDDLGNIESLIRVSNESLDHAGGNPFTFDLPTGTFRDSGGGTIDDDAIQLAVDLGQEYEGNAGRTTLKRNAVLNALVRQESGQGRTRGTGVAILARLVDVGRQFPAPSKGLFYSERGAVRNPSTVERVQSAVTDFIGGKQLPNQLGRVVATTASEIKSHWEPLINKSVNIGSEGDAGVAQAFFDPKTKTVFLIADHISQGNETAVLAHELMHKHGQLVLGKEGWDRLHGVISSWEHADRESEEYAVYSYARGKVAAVGEHLSSQELFPYAVEAALKIGIKPSMAAKKGTVARWLESVRQNMQQVWGKITGKPETFKTQDLVNLAFGISQMENPAHADTLRGVLRGTNDAVTNPDDVVGNQGGRSADDNTTGTDESTGLPLNSDGTVTVYHHTSAANAEAIRKSGQLKADAEPDVYVTTHRDTDTGYGDTAVPIRVRPDQLSIDDEFPNGRKDFRLNVGKPGGSIKVAVTNESTAPDNGGAMLSRTQIVGQTSRQHTPEQLRAMANVGFQVEVPTLAERAKALWQDAGKKMAQGIVDQFAPVKALDGTAYGLLRLAKGASGAFEAFMHGGQLKLTDNVYDFDDQNKGGVVDKLLIPLQGEHHDFMRWVAANRAERLTSEGKENLFSTQDIADLKTLASGTSAFDFTIQNGTNAGTVTRDRTLIYADSLKTFNQFNKNILDMAEQSGLIDGASRQAWEHEFYVPFYRVADEDGGGVRGMNIKGSVIRQQAFKQLKGGKNALNADLLDNTLMNWAHLLDAAAKNRAAKATIEAAEALGVATGGNQTTLAQMGTSVNNKNGVVWFMDGGQKRFSLIDNQGDGPFLMTALGALEYAGMRNPAMSAMGFFKHALTIGVTASPFFKIRNLIRDSVQVIGTSGINVNPLANVAQGWKLTDPKSDAYFRLLAGGGTIHFGTMLEGSEAKRIQALVESGVNDSTILGDQHKVKAFYRKFIEPGISAYNELGNRGEAINRAALYDQLVKGGMNHADASLQARDLMDFSMQGSFTTIRFLTQVVPFFNARIQGLYKLGRAAKEDPARFSAVVGATAMFSIALLAAYGDDDDWKKREEWDRNNFWWFKFGGTAFRIPKPFEIGAIATLAERGFELAFDKEMTGKRFRNQVMTLLGDNLSLNPIPQLVKPMLEIYANKNSFSGRPIETMGMDKLKSEYRFTDRTSMTARGLSTAANSISSLVGVESLSPVQIDSMLRGYFGWLGSFIVGAGDVIARPATGQNEHPSSDMWKVATGSMVSDLRDAPSRYVSQMYTQAQEIEQAYGTWRALQKEGKTQEAEEFVKEHRADLSKYRRVESVKRAEAKFNEHIRIIERSTMDSDKKLEIIRGIRVQKDRVARAIQ